MAITLALAAGCAGALAQEQRPRLAGVSAVRIANYGSPSVVIDRREQVNAVVGELNELRKRPWRRADMKLACYSTVVILSGKKTLVTFRVRPDAVVERIGEKVQTSYSHEIGAGDLPALSRLLAEIAPAKDCS